jgi:hypothetical protein
MDISNTISPMKDILDLNKISSDEKIDKKNTEISHTDVKNEVP